MQYSIWLFCLCMNKSFILLMIIAELYTLLLGVSSETLVYKICFSVLLLNRSLAFDSQWKRKSHVPDSCVKQIEIFV